MFDPDSEKKGARRRSLLSQGTPAHEDAPAARAEAGEGVAERPGWADRVRARLRGAPDSGQPARQTADAAHSGGGAKMTMQSGPAAEDKPLIDPVVLLTTAWRFRFFIAFTTILGAALGVVLALSTPHLYVAVSQFVLDPRELRLTDTDYLPQSYSSDSTLALVDSQVAIVDSSPVLQAVVTDLNLADDPEFNGSDPGEIGGVLTAARGLLNGRDAASDRNFMAVQTLARSVAVYRGERTFIVYVEAETEDPQKSAEIANKIVDVYISKQREAQSALFERTAASLNRQLDELRRDVEAAERRVEQYKAENDLVDAGGTLITDAQLVQLNQQLAQIRAQKVEIQVRAETARQLDVDALLAGTAPEILQSSTIGELRASYAASKRSFDALTTSLGPRHPQRIAAEQALATTRAEISNELRRIVEATQTELRRIIQSEQQLAADLAVLKSQQVDNSSALVRLRELEREASATSQIYQSFLKRARETGEQQNLNTSNIRIISEATPPIEPAGPSRKFIAAGGMVLGFLAGLAIAMLFGAYRSIRDNAGELFSDADEPLRTRPAEQMGRAVAAERLASAVAVNEPDAAAAPPPAPEPAKPRAPGKSSEKPEVAVKRPRPETASKPPRPEPAASEHRADRPEPDRHWAIGSTDQQDLDREADDIRAEIHQMRETVEQLYRARRAARESGRTSTVRNIRAGRGDF